MKFPEKLCLNLPRETYFFSVSIESWMIRLSHCSLYETHAIVTRCHHFFSFVVSKWSVTLAMITCFFHHAFVRSMVFTKYINLSGKHVCNEPVIV